MVNTAFFIVVLFIGVFGKSRTDFQVYGRGGRADGLTFYHKSSVCSRAAYEGDSQGSARVGSRSSIKGTSLFHWLAIRLCTMSIKLVIKSQGDGSASPVSAPPAWDQRARQSRRPDFLSQV